MFYPKIVNIFKITLLCISLNIISTASAAVFVVDDNYNGINSATACEQPAGASFFSTITDARLSAATNTTALPHTIRICPGSYTEDNTFNDTEFVGMTIEGTTSNPTDVQINGVNPNGSVVYLRNDKMTLRNVNVIGGRYGVRTYLADSISLDNLILNKQSLDGILIQSPNNQITNTLIEKVDRYGILFTTAGDSLLIQSTKIISAGNNCIYSNRGNETLIDIAVDGCGRHGVLMLNTAGQPDNLEIKNLTTNNTTLDGLYIRDYNVSAVTNNVDVSDVQITNAGRFGVYLLRNDSINLKSIKINTTTNDGIRSNTNANNVLSNISIDNTGTDGIAFYATKDSSFTDINTNNVGSDGIYLNSTTAKNQFQGISISNSSANGLYNNGGDDNTISKLIINKSDGIAGVYYRSTAQNNVIKGYESTNNTYGIYMNNSQNNTFAYGDVHTNNYGVRLTSNSSNNEFVDNYIHNNSIQGLSILSSGVNQQNSFYKNCFINPVANIINLETGVTNNFDNGSIGNFYGSSPAGSGYSETCVDSDSNAICDVPYTIPTSASGYLDNFPSRDLTSINSKCFSDAVIQPKIIFKKTSLVVFDPFNGTTNPKAIPGAHVDYTLKVTNSGYGNSDNNTVVIVDDLPTNTKLILGSPANPLIFNDGTPSSGLTYTFSGLGSTTDDIDFSNDGGSTFITPSADVNGVDITSPPINFIKISPKGVLNGDSGSGSPNFSMTYRVEVN